MQVSVRAMQSDSQTTNSGELCIDCNSCYSDGTLRATRYFLNLDVETWSVTIDVIKKETVQVKRRESCKNTFCM